jgi:uncharacterized double-CXXCG motif protein
MKLFEVREDEESGYDYDFNAAHRWSLPGVRCDACGWSGTTVGIAYPRLTLPPELDPAPYQSHWPVSPSRLRELIAPLRPLLDPTLPISDCTEFGPVCGTGRGKFGDFVWLNPWTPFISPAALEKLRTCGIDNLTTQPAEIKLRGSRQFDYLELCIEPRVELDPAHSPTVRLKPCPICGHLPPQPIPAMREERLRQESETPIVLGKSFPREVDVASTREVGFILATERFVNCVLELKLTDITFREIQVT